MAQDYKSNPKIKLGDQDLGPEYLDRKNQKIRVTTWIDGDIYDELKKRAKSGEGKGRYQTLMNDLLRSVLFSDVSEIGPEDIKKMKDLFDRFQNDLFDLEIALNKNKSLPEFRDEKKRANEQMLKELIVQKAIGGTVLRREAK